MANRVQHLRGSLTEHSTFTGEKGEISLVTDTSANRIPTGELRIHDGSTAGGLEVPGVARAWVNFDGTLELDNTAPETAGDYMIIRASYNVASVQWNGTGDYTITFATAMPDANYACVVTHEKETAAGQSTIIARSTNLAGSVKILTKAYNTGAINPENVSAAIFR